MPLFAVRLVRFAACEWCGLTVIDWNSSNCFPLNHPKDQFAETGEAPETPERRGNLQ
jgi:hypothetical protein